MASSGDDVPDPSDNNIPKHKSWKADSRENYSSRKLTPASTPPPGFVASEVQVGPASNASSLQKYVWSETDGNIAVTGDTSSTGGHRQQQQHPQTNHSRNDITSSFNNIAAALGSGLAESIEDATRGDHLSNQNCHHDHGINRNHNSSNNSAINAATHGNNNHNLTENFFIPNKNNDMNYERHKRHAASRFLGVAGASSSSPISHKATEAGSLFGVLDVADSRATSAGRNKGTHSSDSDGNSNNVSGNNDTAASVPFRQDPTAAAFHPSYESETTNSSSQLNSNHNNNTRDLQRPNQTKSRLPVTKDLGCTVMEPSDSPYGRGRPEIPTHNLSRFGMGRGGVKSDVNVTYGIQSEMQNLNLWSESGGKGGSGSRSPNPKLPSSNRVVDSIDGGVPGGGNDSSSAEGSRRFVSSSPALNAEEELRPFTWDTNHQEPSRALVILTSSVIPSNEIRSLCESFGVTETFRAEFSDRIGVIFVSYFDMRCAQFAAMQLPTRLQRLTAGAGGIQVRFCAPLNSSSQNDESMVVINDLPNQIGVDNLGRILSSFGAIRSLKDLGGNYDGSSYVAEFHDVQEAKQVVLELESSQPWGPEVSVEVGGRNPSDRKKGRELLALLSRWRNQGNGQVNRGGRHLGKADIYRSHVDSMDMGHRDGRYERVMPHEEHSPPHHGFGLGPTDGRYNYNNTYVVHHTGYPQFRGSHHPSDHVVHGGHGTYVTRQVSHQPPPHQQRQYYPPPQHVSQGNFPGGSSVVSGGSSRHTGASGYYTDDRSTGSRHTGTSGYYTDDRSIGSHQSNVRSVNSLVDSMTGSTRDGQNQHLMLDLDIVENGLDTRTSLMVRNIPNKYTQQMLISEFTENDHGPGVIDFFYLPIDFKNRCNRGYAFINFVDYQDILKFHRQYFGKHWRTFNSDKICDITYARIQGKAAMLKRFENSALMEKDEEYKPLVFVSNGPEKGKRLPFPDSPRGS